MQLLFNKKEKKKKSVENTVDLVIAFVGAFSFIITTRPLAHICSADP